MTTVFQFKYALGRTRARWPSLALLGRAGGVVGIIKDRMELGENLSDSNDDECEFGFGPVESLIRTMMSASVPI